jgi:hypothetical protein
MSFEMNMSILRAIFFYSKIRKKGMGFAEYLLSSSHSLEFSIHWAEYQKALNMDIVGVRVP